ncbi:ABC transporter permease [Mycobacterium sp.]|uniref:ABC transporter permease n=1 Tax=Mycobacterium sp. TaxID=1785 RepID=UPI002BB174FC|nr:ABC transporter permease [Mycobacterium sp.]HKP41514.1 ABC transporter permease [Mycobacterium sp.]
MSTEVVVRQRFPRATRTAGTLATFWRGLGDQTRFFGQTIAGVGVAATHYRGELMRQVASMSFGTGALAIIGGTVAVVAFLTMSTGATVAVVGYNQLSQVGITALVGFASAYLNTRIVTPCTAAVALAATIGAGATAQLGAMRINEEVDALEVMGIRSVAYLASTRLLAGLIVVMPLYNIALLFAYTASRLGTTVVYGQATGVYDHYFNTFLNPDDVLRSFLISITVAVVIMLVHTYYGFIARGGPAGVGEAVGRATRTSLVVGVLVILLVTLALYGQTGDFNFSG